MPVISFPYKVDITGIQITLPDIPGVWEAFDICDITKAVKLVNVQDKDKLPGQARRWVAISPDKFWALVASSALVRKPETSAQTKFRIFGHKGECSGSLNEDELARLDSLGLTLIEDRTTNTSWFGLLLGGDETAADLGFARHVLEAECGMEGLEIRVHKVDFLQK